MRKNVWETRFPTLLGILLIGIGIVVTSFLTNQGVLLITKASPSEIPREVRITNVSDTSFTVSYTTEESVTGVISYGKDKEFGQSAFDEKQQLGEVAPYKTHHITVRNLTPSTTYYFTIISGKNTFLNDTVPFEATTGPGLSSPPNQQQPISGKILLPTGKTSSEAVIYINAPGAQTISKTVKSDGTYIIPLNSVRRKDLSSYVEFSEDSVIHMLVVEDTLQSNVTILAIYAHPIPTLILSNNYDFSVSTTPVATQSATVSTKITGFPSFSAKEVTGKDPQILTPKKNEGFTDQQPVFRGTASPNETVTITIHSQENIKTQVTSSNAGVWTYRPDSALSPGEHTISIISRGKNGILKTITQSFTVYAAGTQVSETATPSATPTLAVTPTTSPTPLPTLTPISTPTPTVEITSSPTPTPLVAQPSPTTSKGGRQIDAPGSSSLIPIGIMAVGTTLVGTLLFLLTRGGSSL